MPVAAICHPSVALAESAIPDTPQSSTLQATPYGVLEPLRPLPPQMPPYQPVRAAMATSKDCVCYWKLFGCLEVIKEMRTPCCDRGLAGL
jgi:hypothetical protein